MRDTELTFDEILNALPKNEKGVPVIIEIDPDARYALSPDLRREIVEACCRVEMTGGSLATV